MELNLEIIRHHLIFLIDTLGLFYIAKVAKDFTTPYNLNAEIYHP